MKPHREAVEIRSFVQATSDEGRGTRDEGKRLFLRHEGLALSFKNGKLRLAGKKRRGVFRVRLEDVKEIRWWANGWQVNFRVESQTYRFVCYAGV